MDGVGHPARIFCKQRVTGCGPDLDRDRSRTSQMLRNRRDNNGHSRLDGRQMPRWGCVQGSTDVTQPVFQAGRPRGRPPVPASPAESQPGVTSACPPQTTFELGKLPKIGLLM